MPRQRSEPVPERGALVVGHLYPSTFAWIIKTGTAVDRAALAARCNAGLQIEAAAEARRMLAARNMNPAYLHDFRSLIIATRQALIRPKGVNHGNDRPKSKHRIEAEAAIIHAILKIAAARSRGSI